MASQNAEGQKSRPPTIDDLVSVCRRLNEAGAKYILIGGFAINYYGVNIPIADISTMIKTKQGIRPRDKEDLSFLMSVLKEEGGN